MLAQIWDRAIIYLDRWVMIGGTGHEDDAYKFLKFYANPKLQAEYAITKLPYGPTSVGAAGSIRRRSPRACRPATTSRTPISPAARRTSRSGPITMTS